MTQTNFYQIMFDNLIAQPHTLIRRQQPQRAPAAQIGANDMQAKLEFALKLAMILTPALYGAYFIYLTAVSLAVRS